MLKLTDAWTAHPGHRPTTVQLSVEKRSVFEEERSCRQLCLSKEGLWDNQVGEKRWRSVRHSFWDQSREFDSSSAATLGDSQTQCR